MHRYQCLQILYALLVVKIHDIWILSVLHFQQFLHFIYFWSQFEFQLICMNFNQNDNNLILIQAFALFTSPNQLKLPNLIAQYPEHPIQSPVNVTSMCVMKDGFPPNEKQFYVKSFCNCSIYPYNSPQLFEPMLQRLLLSECQLQMALLIKIIL